jgi:hypothetical protein
MQRRGPRCRRHCLLVQMSSRRPAAPMALGGRRLPLRLRDQARRRRSTTLLVWTRCGGLGSVVQGRQRDFPARPLRDCSDLASGCSHRRALEKSWSWLPLAAATSRMRMLRRRPHVTAFGVGRGRSGRLGRSRLLLPRWRSARPVGYGRWVGAVASLDHHVGGLQDRRSLESGCEAEVLDRVACDGSGDQERAGFDLDSCHDAVNFDGADDAVESVPSGKSARVRCRNGRRASRATSETGIRRKPRSVR